jgi:hypothetical protein
MDRMNADETKIWVGIYPRLSAFIGGLKRFYPSGNFQTYPKPSKPQINRMDADDTKSFSGKISCAHQLHLRLNLDHTHSLKSQFVILKQNKKSRIDQHKTDQSDFDNSHIPGSM